MARNVDPDLSADCHHSGSVPTLAHVVRGGKELTLCGHHLMRAIDKLTEEGWEVIPVKRTVGSGVGTEATPNHYAIGEPA